MAEEGMTSCTHKTWLNEISFMRPVLLVLLVMYHAFAPFVGAWKMMDGIQEVEVYRWIGKLAYAFLLEGFVFMSGYVFTYQIVGCRKYGHFRSLLTSKIQRLLIPGFFFSALYIFCFEEIKDYEGFNGIINFCLALMGGVAHLWYLPCLFWCFLIQYLLIRKNVPVTRCLPILFVLVIVSIVPLPIRLNVPLYYMLFFYGGGLFWHYSQTLCEKATKKRIAFLWFVFALLFIVISYMMDAVHGIIEKTDNLLIRGLFYEFNTILKIIMSWIGITALYLTACRYCRTKKIGKTILNIGSCAYGVYVFHQFILIYLYRYTEMPNFLGTYLLPWSGILITLFVSVILTMAVRRTKIGRLCL